MSYEDQAVLGMAIEKLVEAFCEQTNLPPGDVWELVEQIAKDRT